MGRVFTHMTMSLTDIAEPDDQVGELFDCYEAGEVSVASRNEDVAFNVDEATRPRPGRRGVRLPRTGCCSARAFP